MPTTTIVRLLLRRRPSHVPWFVVPVIVRETIKAMSRRWAWTYISEERFERIAPPRAYRNAAAPVVMEGVISRSEAPIFSLLPRCIFWRWLICASSGVAVSAFPVMRTPATEFSFTTHQAACPDWRLPAAVASAQKTAFAVHRAVDLAKNDEAAESLPGSDGVTPHHTSIHRGVG